MSFMQGQAPQAAALPPPPPPPMPAPAPSLEDAGRAAAASSGPAHKLSLTPSLIKQVQEERAKLPSLADQSGVDTAALEKLEINNELAAARHQAGARDAR